MNMLQSTLDEVLFRIPEEVLNLAFMKEQRSWRRAPTNLNEEILNKVIKPRIMKRMSERGGQTVMVNLKDITPIFNDRQVTVYRIPPHLLNNREIVCVLSASYLPSGMSFTGFGTQVGTVYPGGTSELTMLGTRIMDAASSLPIISTAQIDLVGHNTIMVRDQIKNVGMYQVRLQVTDDPYLNNIHPRSAMVLSKLFELGIKAYVYNKLIVKMDAGVLDMGQELGAFRNIVESYSDAEEMYQEWLRTKWGKIAFLNDEHRSNRHIRSMINPSL